jgi:membrane protease YdiL (CAAX protease family)
MTCFLSKAIKQSPLDNTIIIDSSMLFAIGHFNQRKAVIVLYDIFFVFINSVLYGVIFHKTNNA